MENNNNDEIIGLSNEFLIELALTKPSNLQHAVNKYFDLWNKDGGLIEMLGARGMGVYKVLASILVKGGYGNANERNVATCVNRLLKSRVPASGGIRMDDMTSYVDTTTKDSKKDGVCVPMAGVTPAVDRVVKTPVEPRSVGVVVSPPSDSSSTAIEPVGGWWNEVAQALGVQLKKVSENFDWDFVGRNLEHQNGSGYKKEFTEQELELLGNVLMHVERRNLDALDLNVVKNDFYIKKEKEIVGWLLAKVEANGYIKI